jgi:protoporphyrinogen oxidase
MKIDDIEINYDSYDYVIVGAGIAGLTAAYFLADGNRKILLIDSDKVAGGLLKSDSLGGSYFDYGTHAMSETGVQELDEFLFSECTDKEYKITKLIETGNYYNDELNEANCTVDLSTLNEDLRNRCYYELLQTKDLPEYDTLEDFFVSKYGQSVYDNVFYEISKKYFGEEPSKLHYSAGYFFDMSHVLAFNEDICESLKNVGRYNKVLSHHVRVDGLIKHYPRSGGLSTFIDMLMKKVVDAGVEVKLNSKMTNVEIDADADSIDCITINDHDIKLKHLIWTLPPGLFVFLSGIKNIKTSRPVFRGTTLFDYIFDKPLKTKCNFINIYQPDMLSGRITIYENMGGTYNDDTYTCTVEVLSDQTLDESYIDTILRELNKIGIIDESYICKYSGTRVIKTGFPVIFKEFVENNAATGDDLLKMISNITLSGKGAGKMFFMGDVLRDMHKQVTNLN